MPKKTKIAWICHFSNQDVRRHLPLTQNFTFINFIKRIKGKSESRHRDFAPWVTNLIKEFEKFEDVELHVISPHMGLKWSTCDFEMNGIHYHFFKPDVPVLHCPYPSHFFGTGAPHFKNNRRLVKRFIQRIRPDVINLIGTENPYYSITALDIDGIPVFASAQTVYTNPDRKRLSGTVSKLNWDLELRLHKQIQYFGCSGRMHHDLIKNNNPDAIIFKNVFPKTKPVNIEGEPKEFDFVFFAAGVSPNKGIEDALAALAIVKESKAEVSLHVVGICAPNYKRVLEQTITELQLSDNVVFKDYFPVHSDMHQYIKRAKVAVIPIKLDIISGTVIEAMLLELPIVTYKTTGTPYLNKDGVTVLLADIGDTETLAKHMLTLIYDPEYAKAKSFVETEFDNTKSAERLLACLRAVIDHRKYNTPIPKELLFDLEEFPLY